MINNITPVFDNVNNIHKKQKNDDIEYINIRSDVKLILWRLFKGIVNIKGLKMPEALSDAIYLWIDKTDAIIVSHICNYCKNDVAMNNYYYKFIDNEHYYYCSSKCLNNVEKIIEKEK